MRFFRRRDLDEEMRFHQDQLAAEGLAPSEAARAFGNDLLLRERGRDAWGWRWLEALGSDLRLAARHLRRSPGFTLVVALTLALGIGANAAVFAVMNAMLLRPLPVKDPAQLTLPYWITPRMPVDLDNSGTTTGLPDAGRGGGDMYSLGYADFQILHRAAAPLATAVFGFAPLGDPSTTVVANGSAGLVHASLVSEEYFTGLGVAALRGRLFGGDDFRPGAPLAAVISDAFWARRFGRSPAAVGQTILVNQRPAVVVGIAPPRFTGVKSDSPQELWLPLVPGNGLVAWDGYQPPSGDLYTSHLYWWLEVMVRRRAGVSESELGAALAARMDPVFQEELRPVLKSGERAPRLEVVSGAQGINALASTYGPALRLLMAGVGLLLLLACVNVAALLLARASARRREIGVRLALGAPRSRLVVQLLTESGLLALLGGALGLAVAPVAARGLTALLAAGDRLAVVPALDARVLGFTFAVAVITGLAFGLAPALRCTRADVQEAVKRGNAPAAPHRLRTDKALAIIQTALSLLLLVGAGLLLRTLRNLEQQPLGFRPDHVLTFAVDARQAGYPAAALPGFYLNLQARLAALPGVSAAGVSQHSLLGGDSGGDDVRAPASAAPLEWRDTQRNGIGPGFFAALGIPVLRGRAIGELDVRAARPVAVINAALAREYFGGADPIGQLLLRRDANNASTAFTVVGVAGDARYGTLRGRIQPTYYIPYTRIFSLQALTFELRTVGKPDAILPAVRQAVQALEPGLALARIATQADQDVSTLGNQRLLAQLGAVFALLGLLLASLGIEGTMAYAVLRRTRDIGVRMALGADRGRVARAVLAEALGMALAGIALGAGLSLLAVRWIGAQLYGVAPHDPATFAAAGLTLAAVAALAAWLPARRAAAVDPMLTLRCE